MTTHHLNDSNSALKFNVPSLINQYLHADKLAVHMAAASQWKTVNLIWRIMETRVLKEFIFNSFFNRGKVYLCMCGCVYTHTHVMFKWIYTFMYFTLYQSKALFCWGFFCLLGWYLSGFFCFFLWGWVVLFLFPLNYIKGLWLYIFIVFIHC